MIVIKISGKRINVGTLKTELIAAGFNTFGASAASADKEDDWQTEVYLDDSEKKDPKSVIEAHMYVAPKTSQEISDEEKAQYSMASNKLDFVARKLGLL